MKLFFVHKKSILFFLSFIIFIIVLLYVMKLSLHMVSVSSTDLEGLPKNSFDTIPNIMKHSEKIAFLTFDDGPTKTVTPKILAILKEENIKATFFVIGKSVEEYPEIVKQAYEEGHYIANHSYSHHNSKLYKSRQSFIEEIQKTEIAIGNAIHKTDYCSHLFRFPNGYMSSLYKKEKIKAASILQEMEYSYIDWNCLTKDAEIKCNNYQLLNNLKQTSQNKGTLVVLMHDTKDVNDSSFVLKDAIAYLRSQGYTFQNFYSLIK